REAIKQWTNVFGYSETPQSTQSNSPVNGWTRFVHSLFSFILTHNPRSIYGPLFQAITAQGVSHNIPIQGNDVINWFQLNVANPTTPANPPTSSGGPSTTSVAPPTTTYTPPVVTPT